MWGPPFDCCYKTPTVTTLPSNVVHVYIPWRVFTHLGGAGVYVRQVDGAGSEVDEGHGNALPRQSGKLVEVHCTELEIVDEIVWFRTPEGEDEVLFVEGRDLFLQGQRYMGA